FQAEDGIRDRNVTGVQTCAFRSKTGTTQNQSDGWFIGMVPDLVTGVWVGGEDRATRFSNLTYGQGATMALPIWGLYMKKCYADRSEERRVGKECEARWGACGMER